jgi:ribonuclease HI
MRKTDVKGNNRNILPQNLLPKGANPWEDQKFVEAYNQVAGVVNTIPYNPQVKEVIRNVKPVAAATAAILRAIKEHKPSKEALRLIGEYESSTRKQAEERIRKSLRLSSANQQISPSEIQEIQRLSQKILLGIPTPGQINAISPQWSPLYGEVLELLEQVHQNPQNQDLLTRLAASTLALTEGVYTLGREAIPSPFSKIHIHPTTDVTGSTFLPSAETLAQTARLVETHGAAAVREAMNRAREATITKVEQVIATLSSLLTRDQDDQKLDAIANSIISHLRNIREQHHIEVPGIDLESQLTTETRARATRTLEELLRTFSSLKEIEQSNQRRITRQSRYRIRPSELSPERTEQEAEFHSRYSMYSVGGTKPPRNYEQHTLQKAQQEDPQLRREFFEEQMHQYYTGFMKLMATIAGIAARYWADINLRNELNALSSQQPTTNQNQNQVREIELPVVTAYGSTSVLVAKRTIEDDQGNEAQTARGYIPLGLPLGLAKAQPQLPSTFEETQIKPTATITIGNKRIEVTEGETPNRVRPRIRAINPQQTVTHTIPVSREANQRLLAPIIQVVHTDNNTIQIRARVQEIIAPTISEEQIQTIKNQIAETYNLILNRYSRQRSIPENLISTFEMAKALANSPGAEFHSALLRIEEEAIHNGSTIRKPVLNITFRLPENELKMMQEAARINENRRRLQESQIPTEESDTVITEEPSGRQTSSSRNTRAQILSVGTYKRSQVLQPTFEEAQPGSTNRQTAADRLVVVSFEIVPGNYEEIPDNNLHPIEEIVFNIYRDFKQRIESGIFIESYPESTEFFKELAPGESLVDAIKEATQYLDFEIARRINATMQNERIAQLYAERINREYALLLPQARSRPDEFERITQQSALPIFQRGPITFMARPIVKVDHRTREPKLELLVLGYARTTPYLLKIQGANNPAEAVSDIISAHMGIFNQSLEGRTKYSGGIFARYELTVQDVSGEPEAIVSERPIQKGYAPDSTLASGAAGLPSGVVTIARIAANPTTETIEEGRQSSETETAQALLAEAPTEESRDDGNEQNNRPATAGQPGLPNIPNLIEHALGAGITRRETENDTTENRREASEESREAAPSIEGENTQPAPPGANVIKPPEDPNIRRTETIELPLTEADQNEPTTRIFIVADGGTTDNQRGRDALKPTGTGTIVIGIIKDQQTNRKIIKVYRINHRLGDKSNLTNNKAEAFALLTGATLAREMIEALREKGIVQNKDEVEVWMMSDSQLMVGQISGLAEARDPLLRELVKRTVGTIKDQAGTIKIAHHSKSNGNPLGRLIHEVDELSRIPREDRGGGSYQKLNIETELEQALNDFKAKAEARNYQDLGRSTVSAIRNIETVEPIQRNEPLTTVRITDLIPQSEANTPGQVFDLDISDFVNDFRQSIDSTNQESAPAPPASQAPPATGPEPTPAETPAATANLDQQQTRQPLQVINKFFGSIKKLEQAGEQQKEWDEIYQEFKSKTRTTIKRISEGTRRGIDKKVLMLIAGAQRAEHRPALDQIISDLADKQVFASQAISAQIPDLIGNTPNQVRLYKAAQIGQLQARPQATQSTIDPNAPFVSFHGRRDASREEIVQSFKAGRKIAQAGGVLVVGGAVGADFAATLGALSEGGKVVIVHFRDLNTDEYGYPEFTIHALTNIYNNRRTYQEDNFVRFVVSELTRNTRNATVITRTFSKLSHKLATVMTLIAIAPNHPIIQTLLREANTELPTTAAVAFYTLRAVSREQEGQSSQLSATIRDKLLVAISELTIEGPNRGQNSGTDLAVRFAQEVAQQSPDEKAVMTMQEILTSDLQSIQTRLEELNEARKRNLEAYKQRQQS